MASGGMRNVAHRLYAGDISYDFIGRRRRWYALSGVVMLISLISLIFVGIKPSIDFKGGDQITITKYTDVAKAQSVMDKLGLGGDQSVVQTVGTGADRQLRITTKILQTNADDPTHSELNKVEDALKKDLGVKELNVTQIGATWGDQITQKAVESLMVFLIVVMIYLSIRFQSKMAAAALIALVHDLLITAGIYALVGFEVSPSTVIGLLTILGYSLYDTVVVFDKVRENTARHRGGQQADLQRGRQPRGQPDAGPLDQHLDHRAAAGGRPAVHRRRPARRRHAQGPRARAVHRSGDRCLLLDLHRDPAAVLTSRSASRP